MAQVVSRRLFIAEARVRSQPSVCEFSGEKSGTGTGNFFFRVFHFSPACTILKMLHNHLPVHVALTRRAKGRSLRTFWKAVLCFGNRGGVDKEVLLLAFKRLRSSREDVYIHSRKLWTAVTENIRCKKFAICTHCLRVTRHI